jgi:hypothetical protein
MRNSLVIAILFLFCSCSANYYLKRSQKLERRAIEMGAKVTVDTVYVDRQVIVPERSFDTVVQSDQRARENCVCKYSLPSGYGFITGAGRGD